MAAIAAVDKGALDRDPGQPFHLGKLGLQRMAVMGQAGTGHGADHELAGPGPRIDHGEGGLDTELVAGAGLALGDAFDLRGMQRIELVLVVRLLGQKPDDRFADGRKASSRSDRPAILRSMSR